MNTPTLETPLVDLLDTYLTVKNPGGKPDTGRLHRQAIKRFGETLGHTPTVCDLTDEHIGLHAQKRLADGKSRDTAQGEQKKLLAQWRFYARRGYTKVWPECKPISGVKRTPKAWTKEDFDKLYQKCELAAAVDDTPGVVWWRCLLSCLFFTGERVGAMLQLEWSGVDLDGGWLELPAEVRKNSATDRRYKIPSETVELLRKMPRDKGGPFDCGMCMETIYNRFKGILKKAGLPTDRRSMFHRIRRTTASHYAAAGGNAQQLLGHSSPAVTERYIDPEIAPQPQAVDLLIDPETEETVTLGEKKKPGLLRRLRTAIGGAK